MKVLIVSDTHGQDENLEETVLREAPFDYLIHCGDVEGREIFIEALAECPCTIVAGNNDFLPNPLQILIKVEIEGAYALFSIVQRVEYVIPLSLARR